jgi:hypothetical protein
MMAASQVRADARNPASGACGLIQLLPATLAQLGWAGTPEEFRQLGAVEQLPYVEAHLQPYVHYGIDAADRLYRVVLMPSSVAAGHDADTVIAARDGQSAEAYERSRWLDADYDGTITVCDLRRAVERHYDTPRWHELVERLERASGAAAGAPAANDGAGPADLRTRSGVLSALEALGYDRVHYSPASAVRAFQQRSGLATDGIAGPRTRAALIAALEENELPYRI